MEVWGLVSLLLFYLFIFAIGLFAARKLKKSKTEHNSEDVMLAGRDLGMAVGVLSMTATWVDGGFINGTAETVFTSGILWCQGPIGCAVQLIVCGLLYASKMREAGHVTMLDAFAEKYGKWMTVLFFIPCMMSDVMYVGAIFSALGETAAVVIELDVRVSVIVSGIVAILYTMAGGMYSVTYTDVVSACIIFLGLWLCIPFCMMNPAVGSLTDKFGEIWGTISNKDIGPYVDSLLLIPLGAIPIQPYFQRVFSCKTTKIAKKISYIAGFFCIFLAVPPVLIGIIARSTDWQLTYRHQRPSNARDESMILPIVLKSLVPTVVTYISLGAVAGGVMSSSDAGILSSSSQFIRNVYKPVFRPKASEKELEFVLRIAMVFFGIIAIMISLSVSSIYGLWVLSGDLNYVLMFPQLTCLLFLDRHCNAYGSGAAFVICLILRLLFGEPVLGFPPLIKLPYFDEDRQMQMIPYKTILMLLDFLLIIGVSKLANCVLTGRSSKLTISEDISVEDRPGTITKIVQTPN